MTPSGRRPAVTVCVPTFNGARHLRQCLESILRQTFSDFEVLVVDDQSGDGTLEIAQEYAKGDSRIRVAANDRNIWMVQNWNRCMELANGEWIKFVFQDDFIEPDCLKMMVQESRGSRLVRVCERNIVFDGVSADVQKLYEKHRARWSIRQIFLGLTDISAEAFCRAVRKYVGVNFIGEPTAVILHREVFRRFGGFNSNLIQLCDLEYWIRVGIHTGFTYIPKVLAAFRVHDEGATLVNRSERYYRTRLIDPLILMHDLAYSPAFEPLRRGDFGVAGFGLRRKLAKIAYKARRVAESAAADPSHPDSRSLEEWRRTLARYPSLEKSLYYHFVRFREYFKGDFWRSRWQSHNHRRKS